LTELLLSIRRVSTKTPVAVARRAPSSIWKRQKSQALEAAKELGVEDSRCWIWQPDPSKSWKAPWQRRREDALKDFRNLRGIGENLAGGYGPTKAESIKDRWRCWSRSKVLAGRSAKIMIMTARVQLAWPGGRPSNSKPNAAGGRSCNWKLIMDATDAKPHGG